MAAGRALTEASDDMALDSGSVWDSHAGWDGLVLGERLDARVLDSVGNGQHHPDNGVALGNNAEAVLDAPASEDGPQPVDVAAPAPAGEGERGQIICAVFGDLCAKALRVAECESGPDYSAEFDGVHIGPFQIAARYHAGKFMAHGWDIYSEGNDPYKNATIALEILAGRGYIWTGSGGWPNCGYR